ncbi:cobalt-precorrin 5A hydrolase [Pseudonocardia autotrophica]|uniref:Cobalamin biosynthesis protein CbiG n=2 Tax=Pseudonocardia TaxID=1847 RepID=A0A1Y2MRN2_PSEAH|nr:cobalamin biosynthesis protein CbiG [Pseudonocardia autotrophica]TDN72453.1 cobalt-precorrin 5A hydrolase [Pseudonocardia autotrophica]
MRPGVSAAALRALLRRVADEHGLDLDHAVVATLDRRTSEPGLLQAVAPRTPRGYPAEQLAAVVVPTPSDRVAAATGTPAVAEAAALLAAGPGAVLVVPKTAASGATVAVARLARATRVARAMRMARLAVGMAPSGAAPDPSSDTAPG